MHGPVREIMGRLPIGPECFNCLAPDNGSMQTVILYGTNEHHSSAGGRVSGFYTSPTGLFRACRFFRPEWSG
jgi:hypothetical protein